MKSVKPAQPRAAMRGSSRILDAWMARGLSDESVKEIASGLSESKGTIEAVEVSGGEAATGMRVGLSYAGDDVWWCGNDIIFWLKWLAKNGGKPKPPRIIINGKPYPDELFMEIDFGHFAEVGQEVFQAAELAEIAEVAGHVRG
jgi:hypothetical protein